MSEPRLNKDRTRVICGWRSPEGNECQEWLARWDDNWSHVDEPDDPAPTGPLTIRPGFHVVAGLWRESTAGRRRRAGGRKYRHELSPPPLVAGFAEHTTNPEAYPDYGPEAVACPRCRQERLLDPGQLQGD